MMKTDDLPQTTPRLQTINECLQVLPKACPAHSGGNPDGSSTLNNLDVRFAPDSIFQLRIKHVPKTAPSSSLALVADLLRHPEILEAVLNAAESGNEACVAARAGGRSPATSVRKNEPALSDDARNSCNRGFAEPPESSPPPMTLKRRMILLAGLAMSVLVLVG